MKQYEAIKRHETYMCEYIHTVDAYNRLLNDQLIAKYD